MDVVLELDADRVARRAVHEFCNYVRRRGHDLRPAWEGVLEAIYEQEDLLFANEGRNSEEGEWAPLSDRPIRFHKIDGVMVGYLTWKRRHYPGKGVGELTGKLRRQLTRPDGGAFVYRGPRRLRFGTSYEDYSGVEGRPRSGRDRLTGDLGGIAAEGRDNYYPMPARTPIRVDQVFLDAIKEPVLDYLTAPMP